MPLKHTLSGGLITIRVLRGILFPRKKNWKRETSASGKQIVCGCRDSSKLRNVMGKYNLTILCNFYFACICFLYYITGRLLAKQTERRRNWTKRILVYFKTGIHALYRKKVTQKLQYNNDSIPPCFLLFRTIRNQQNGDVWLTGTSYLI